MRNCSYCGNSSGKQDMRGNCVGCGAPLLIINENEIKTPLSIDHQWLMIGGQPPTPKWYIEEYYRGFSGSPYGYNIQSLFKSQIFTPQEIRDMENG